jgi:hypothetical protein
VHSLGRRTGLAVDAAIAERAFFSPARFGRGSQFPGRTFHPFSVHSSGLTTIAVPKSGADVTEQLLRLKEFI